MVYLSDNWYIVSTQRLWNIPSSTSSFSKEKQVELVFNTVTRIYFIVLETKLYVTRKELPWERPQRRYSMSNHIEIVTLLNMIISWHLEGLKLNWNKLTLIRLTRLYSITVIRKTFLHIKEFVLSCFKKWYLSSTRCFYVLRCRRV